MMLSIAKLWLIIHRLANQKLANATIISGRPLTSTLMSLEITMDFFCLNKVIITVFIVPAL